MRLALALVVGFALGCGADPLWCASAVGCDHCRDCATSVDGACEDPWNACTFDPICSNILACLDDCAFASFSECELMCRGTNLGGGVIYDDLVGCLDDACSFECS